MNPDDALQAYLAQRAAPEATQDRVEPEDLHDLVANLGLGLEDQAEMILRVIRGVEIRVHYHMQGPAAVVASSLNLPLESLKDPRLQHLLLWAILAHARDDLYQALVKGPADQFPGAP